MQAATFMVNGPVAVLRPPGFTSRERPNVPIVCPRGPTEEEACGGSVRRLPPRPAGWPTSPIGLYGPAAPAGQGIGWHSPWFNGGQGSGWHKGTYAAGQQVFDQGSCLSACPADLAIRPQPAIPPPAQQGCMPRARGADDPAGPLRLAHNGNLVKRPPSCRSSLRPPRR